MQKNESEKQTRPSRKKPKITLLQTMLLIASIGMVIIVAHQHSVI